MKAIALSFSILIFGLVVPAAGQFSIDWFSIEGGGGTSSGGVFTVSGSVGQPDAGDMSGGDFSLSGGFWSIVAAVQAPGAPPLAIAWSSNNTVVISWPLPGTGWRLQAATGLEPPGSAWTDCPPVYQTNATSLFYVDPAPIGKKFYRLTK
jgi:hypothetical protein